jgi:hypothetical protein
VCCYYVVPWHTSLSNFRCSLASTSHYVGGFLLPVSALPDTGRCSLGGRCGAGKPAVTSTVGSSLSWALSAMRLVDGFFSPASFYFFFLLCYCHVHVPGWAAEDQHGNARHLLCNTSMLMLTMDCQGLNMIYMI